MRKSGRITSMLMTMGSVLMAAGVASAQTQLFRSATTYPVSGTLGAPPWILATADVGSPNGGPPDGNPDLITATQDSLRAIVLFGKGDGTFVVGAPSSLGIIPTAAVVGDFDGDGVPDLLVSDTQGVELLPGKNNGTFGPPGARIPVGSSLVALAVDDLNGDGQLDAVVLDAGNPGVGSLTVLLGNGDGTFNAEPSVPLAAGGEAIALADFNGDGNVDIAVANPLNGTIAILSGDGNGGFSVANTIDLAGSSGVAAGDLNGDGQPDLVVVIDNADQVAVLNGLGGGNFAAPRFFTSGTATSNPNGLALADMNLDQKTDVIVYNNFSSDVSVLLGDGQGNLGAPREFVTDQEPRALVVQDLNKDGIPDVATVNMSIVSPDVAVLLGLGDGSLAGVENVPVQANPVGIVAGDVNNDGLCDLIVGQGDGTVEIHRATATGAFAAAKTHQTSDGLVALAVGDLNADGLLDLVSVSSKNTTNLSVLLQEANGGPGVAQQYPIGTGASAIAVGDWNGDGRSDVAVTRHNGTAGAVDIFLANADGSLGTPTSYVVDADPDAIDFGDINNDGKLDLVVGGSQSVAVLMGNGDGSFQSPVAVSSAAGGAIGVAVADYNRDGFNDIAIVQPTSTSGILVLFGDGKGGFAPGPAQPLHVGGIASALVARDLNGDGVPDLLVADQMLNSVTAFISGGASQFFTKNSAITVNRMPTAVAAGDFDGDGRYDGAALDTAVAATASVLTNVGATAVLRGDGNGDGVISAADLVATLQAIGAGDGTRLEQAQTHGPLRPELDANGDGAITRQDPLAVASLLFPGS